MSLFICVVFEEMPEAALKDQKRETKRTETLWRLHFGSSLPTSLLPHCPAASIN